MTAGGGKPGEHLDVLIVGAGLAGIGAACHLRRACPEKSYAILEARDAIGGTWDQFRYPGVRSDTDMHTLGYRFRPWAGDGPAIADGPSILRYIEQTAREEGVADRVRLGHRVVRAEWSRRRCRWQVEVERPGAPAAISCDFLYVCAGYYRYEQGHSPEFPGAERFRGRIVHPQHWPRDLDCRGMRVVVVGSGATAVSLAPALAARAAGVTLLQRSPGYMISIPARDPLGAALGRVIPATAVHSLVRWKNIARQSAFYLFCRGQPELARWFLRRRLGRSLPRGYDVDAHFSPRYAPWDKRLCVVADDDLFDAIADGSVAVVTDRIDTFTERGIRLRSGRELEAELIVTATGLDMRFLGGIELVLDGRPVDLAGAITYKGMMFDGVPNLAFAIGYTNASWTLRVELTAEYVCRLLAHMDATGKSFCRPQLRDRSVRAEPLYASRSGHVQRALDRLPKQGSKAPWRLRMNYPLDLLELRFGAVEDGAMRFGGGAGERQPAGAAR
ncbi:MAG TPA: NAD(P)/FAD-dependent oxidoreductase [Solirubrobacterales bacterium]|nr:NAD(P)/FAD-dependent oxidoreductase [Solirubrobacterales bacterium]